MLLRVHFKHSGTFAKTYRYLTKNTRGTRLSILRDYGELGVRRLMDATPVDSGETSASWYYTIKEESDTTSLYFCNSNINDGVPIAIILQYGHGTNNGGWVTGIDYINPALRDIFNELADSLWKEVASD